MDFFGCDVGFCVDGVNLGFVLGWVGGEGWIVGVGCCVVEDVVVFVVVVVIVC